LCSRIRGNSDELISSSAAFSKHVGRTLSPLEIVVVNTSAGAKYGRQDYVNSGCGMGYEATMYLLERGVRLTGIDGWSRDAPFVYTAKNTPRPGTPGLIWEGHKAGRHIGYCHIEKLHNLELLPPTGFTVSAFRSRSSELRWAGPVRSPSSTARDAANSSNQAGIRTSIGFDGASLHARLRKLCRRNLGRHEGTGKLGLSRFRYPVGCGRFSHR
jgi:hypothetical protein